MSHESMFRTRSKGYYVAEAIRLICTEFVPPIDADELSLVSSSIGPNRAHVNLISTEDKTLTYSVRFNLKTGVIEIKTFRQINFRAIKPRH